MRARRSKKYRKIMSAYQMSFSFREPYQVLLDSSFVKTCHSFHMPLQKYLENTLHGQCRLFVTKCTLAKIMGDWEKEKQRSSPKGDGIRRRAPGRPEFLPPPTELPLRHCKHKNNEGEEIGVVSEARCLLDLLAGQPHGNEHAKNKQHYILATADAGEREQKAKDFIDVRDRARLIPGVPIVYVKRSVMILEELSGASERVRRTGEKEKFSQGLVGLDSRKRKRDDGDGGKEDEELSDDENGPKIRGMRRAKAPNPLSVKKKKVKERAVPTEEDGHNEAPRKKRTRRGPRSQRKPGLGREDGDGTAEPSSAVTQSSVQEGE